MRAPCGLDAMLLALAAAFAASAHAGSAGRVAERNGVITYMSPAGIRTRIVNGAGADPVLSPDDRTVAFVRNHGGRFGSALWTYDIKSKFLRRVLTSYPTADNRTNLRDLHRPAFSPDGRTIYVQSAAWVTSGALFRVDARTGAHHFVSPTNLVLVMRDGPFAGDLIVSEHTYRAEGGAYEQLWLKWPDGTVVMRVPGSRSDSEDAAPWLKRHRWHAW